MRLIILIVLSSIFIGCGKSNKLYIYNWTDYLSPDVIRLFEEKYDCDVIVDAFDSNEMMYAKIMNMKDSCGYDIIFPSSYETKMLKDKLLLEELDHSKIPNFFNNYDIRYDNIILDKRKTFSIPYSMSMCGLGYRCDKVGKLNDNELSWNILTDKRFHHRICLLDDFRQTIGAALKYLGYSANSTNRDDLLKAEHVVTEWKKNISRFDCGQYKTGLASSEILIGHGYNNDIAMMTIECPEIDFFLPKEGFIVTCDEIAIMKSSKNKKMAYEFINFLYDTVNCAKNIEYILGSMPNTNANKYVSQKLTENKLIFPNDDDFLRGEVLKDIGESINLYINVWDNITKCK